MSSTLVVIFSASLLVLSCGQKGPLELPSPDSAAASAKPVDLVSTLHMSR